MNQTVAVIQAAPVAFDRLSTLERVRELAAEAAARGARMAVFPEAFVGGYPKGADFGARVGMRSDKGRELFQRYHAEAITLPGPELDQLCGISRDHALDLVIGVIERDAGTLYCSVVFVSAEGRFLGRRRKLMPTAMERLIWGFGDGSTLEVMAMNAGRVAAAVCWENYMPMLRMSLYQQNPEIWCAPTVDDRPCWIPTMQHIAVEGRCFVLSACPFVRRSDFPDDYECLQGNDPDTVMIRGGSCIIDPFGKLLEGPVYDRQTILIADIDLGRIAEGRYDLDVTGHYARPDIFQLSVDRRPQKPVIDFDLVGGANDDP